MAGYSTALEKPGKAAGKKVNRVNLGKPKKVVDSDNDKK